MQNHKSSQKALILGAIGVVFGDIGTSPLYAFKECLKSFTEKTITDMNVLGLCSLIFWSVFLVVSLKYVVFVMKADNHGEGGILSLMNLSSLVAPDKVKYILVVLGLFGAATFYGDSVITPAISVLSAVEGIELISPSMKSYVLIISCAVLLALFKIQRSGTSSVGKLFGPIMIMWFSSLAFIGVYHILQKPEVLKAFNPYYAFHFLSSNMSIAGLVFGAVFLCLTGGEALYADMGHFGRAPISKSWFWFVFPSLILNYMGQGALILINPHVIDNPFYSLYPHWALIPMVILSTFATVIASQAVISGAFSMTKQAMQLGYLPRIKILHTSDNEIGQIYIPFINWFLFIAVVILLFVFKTSDNLASAYGIAVVTTMFITTSLMAFVIKYQWKWSMSKMMAFLAVFLSLDLIFFATNCLKIMDGGWIPLTFAGLLFFLMMTWKEGRKLVHDSLKEHSFDLDFILPNILEEPYIHKTVGSAVFLTTIAGKTPVSFMHNMKHNHVLHENVFFLTMQTQEIPYVKDEEKIAVKEIAKGCYQVMAYLGFKEQPDVPKLMHLVEKTALVNGWKYEEMDVSFFLSRETIIIKPNSGMSESREKVFAWMSTNATNAGAYFRIPPNRVIELGAQLCI